MIVAFGRESWLCRTYPVPNFPMSPRLLVEESRTRVLDDMPGLVKETWAHTCVNVS